VAMVKAHIQAKDVMTAEPVCVSPSTTIRQLARVLEDNEVSGAPVVDRDGRLVGVVSRADLIRRCTEGSDEVPPAYLFEVLFEEAEEDDSVMPEALVCVEDFMSTKPLTVEPGASVSSVARLMFENREHRVIVISEERFPVGIITSMDLLGFFPQ
jgi:CBS domain-containing protein